MVDYSAGPSAWRLTRLCRPLLWSRPPTAGGSATTVGFEPRRIGCVWIHNLLSRFGAGPEPEVRGDVCRASRPFVCGGPTPACVMLYSIGV